MYRSVCSCHLFLISSASVRSLPFTSFLYHDHPCMKCSLDISNFLEEISVVFPILLFSSISLHCSFKKAFLSLLAILWNSVFKYDTHIIGCGGRCYLNLEKSAMIFKTTIECPTTILICILSCTSLCLGKFSIPQIYTGGPDVFVIFLSHAFFGHVFWLVVTQRLTS